MSNMVSVTTLLTKAIKSMLPNLSLLMIFLWRGYYIENRLVVFQMEEFPFHRVLFQRMFTVLIFCRLVFIFNLFSLVYSYVYYNSYRWSILISLSVACWQISRAISTHFGA